MRSVPRAPRTARTRRPTLDRSSVAPGESLTVGGAGFLAGEQVEVWVHSDPQWVGTTTATADGSVSYTFAVPADLPAGEHHVELVGVSSGLVLASPAFTVVDPAAPRR